MRLSLLIPTLALLSACNAQPDTSFLLIGSYASAEEEGIKVYKFNQETADCEYVSGMSGISNPSFLYPTHDGHFVYAVGEDVAPDTPTANALSFDKSNGTLSLINSQLNPGDAPCNIIVSPDGQWAYTSNYFGGNIDEYRIEKDGSLGPARSIAFEGSSIDTIRQTHPYLHAVNFTPDHRFLLANDLGTDQIHIFPADGPLDTGQQFDLQILPGVGPRHLCFSPSGNYAYLLGEISGDIVTIGYDIEGPSAFRMTQVTKADTLNAGGSADIHVSPDGRFVYASHRLVGDGISIFKIHQADGSISKVGYQNTGIHPRNFIITPNGKFLLVACRDSNVVEIYERDMKTGLLKDTGKKIEMSKPVCLQLID